MIRQKLIYLVILALTIFAAVMYPGQSLSTVIAFELLLALLCLLSAGLTGCFLKRDLRMKDDTIFLGDKIQAVITIENRSILPAPRVELVLAVINQRQPKKNIRRLSVKLPARDKVEIELDFVSANCGISEISLERCMVYDFLALFRWIKWKNVKDDIIVLPALEEMEVKLTEEFCGFNVEAEEYDPLRSGDDPSEILKLRDYQPGDKLSRVHWKMSAKVSHLLIKERSLPLGFSVGIFCDIRCRNLEESDALMAVLYSLSYSLLLNQCRHFIWWRDPIRNDISCEKVSKEEDLFFVMEHLLRMPCQDGMLDLGNEKERREEQSFYHLYFLSAGLKKEEWSDVINWKKAQKRTLFLIDKTPEEISEIEADFLGEVECFSCEQIGQQLSGYPLQI